ncbi:hypothetical protein JCM33374_g5724 [Metschnikowia sp. JCM 33374]|nr:hypothetical protein JCM33374_g5724 [Metschnikowia sp. JCM 33374]
MERIFYQTDLIDAYSGYPIYIFDTSYLPSPEDVNYDFFIPTLMKWLPKKPYMVILFSCGLNKISWVWGISFLKAFFSQSSSGVSNAENLHKIIAVHESWFVKSVSQIFTNFLVSKKTLANFNNLLSSLKISNDLLISCNSLSDLSNYVDVTNLKISLNIYRHDYQITLSPEISLHCPYNPTIKSSTGFSPKTDPLFYHHFYQIFNIVDLYADQVELLFHRPGKKLNTEILFHCLKRNQVIWINDWDLDCVASCFKKILTEVPNPIVDSKKILLPMKDDLQYTSEIFESMMAEEHKNVVLYQIISLSRRIVDKSSVTKHTFVSISKSLSHALTHESISNSSKDSISIVVRFLKNLLNHWQDISPQYASQFKTVQQIAEGEYLKQETSDEQYNTSLKTKVQSSSDEEENSKANTESIFSSAASAKDSQSGYCPSIETINDASETDLEEKGNSSNEDRSKNLPLQNMSNNTSNDLLPKNKEKVSSISENKTPNKDIIEEVSRTKDDKSIQRQFPPQKYKFENSGSEEKPAIQGERPKESLLSLKKPVIRGRKVGELTRLFEERSQAMDILNTM